jgi:hypothetical protein
MGFLRLLSDVLDAIAQGPCKHWNEEEHHSPGHQYAVKKIYPAMIGRCEQ